MTAIQVLITTGTPDAGWAEPATALLRGLGPEALVLPEFSRWAQAQQGAVTSAVPGFGRADGGPWGGLDAAAAPLLPQLGQRFPKAHGLFFVQSPVETLAAWIEAGGQGSPEPVLAAWRQAAQALLGHLPRHRERCLLIDVAEWRVLPAAAAQRIASFLGVEAPPAPTPAPAALNPLPLALAQAWVAGRTELLRLHAECVAACDPLGEACPDLPSVQLDEAVLAGALADWRARQAAGARQAQEQQTLLDGLLAAQESWVSAQAQWQVEQQSMLRQLHAVQDQLEQCTREQVQLAGLASPLRADGLSLARLVVGDERDLAPHRELALVLHAVRAADRERSRVECRLIEHHGHVGLTLLQPPGVEPPLLAWSPSGQEGDRPYVLLVPDDDDGARRLDALGTGDRRFVEALVARIEAALLQDTARAARWLPVAVRLRERLVRQPDRWRYDRLRAEPQDGGYRLVFDHVECGRYRARALSMHWRPRPGAGAALTLHAPAELGDAPLLAAWPLGEDGRWRADWPLPVQDGRPVAEQRARWQALPVSDRQLLLALLAALPGVAGLQPPPPGLDAGALASAHGLLRAAQRLQHGPRWRRVLRALRGRDLSPR
jgi:hypothetical protein